MLWMTLILVKSVMVLALRAATLDSLTVLHVRLATWSTQEPVSLNVPMDTLPILRMYASLDIRLVQHVATQGYNTASNA